MRVFRFQKQFLDEVLGCGMLLYLSESWLREVYRLLVEKDYLFMAGYRAAGHKNSSFTSLLMDVDGLGYRMPVRSA